MLSNIVTAMGDTHSCVAFQITIDNPDFQVWHKFHVFVEMTWKNMGRPYPIWGGERNITCIGGFNKNNSTVEILDGVYFKCNQREY